MSVLPDGSSTVPGRAQRHDLALGRCLTQVIVDTVNTSRRSGPSVPEAS